jgi:hypothetical protein
MLPRFSDNDRMRVIAATIDQLLDASAPKLFERGVCGEHA